MTSRVTRARWWRRSLLERSRPLRRGGGVLALAILFTLATATSGAAQGTLNGEELTSVGPPASDAGCSNGTIRYDVAATATGPYPGTGEEFGEITLSGGTVTFWHATFIITSGATIVRGTVDLAPGGTGIGTCLPNGGSASSATLTYTTSSPFVETGPTQTSMTFAFTGPNSFVEHFGPTVMPGCDTNGNGNGNDECNQ